MIYQLAPRGRIVVAGHSLGGPVIMALAKRHPGLLRGQVAGVAFVATSGAHLGRDVFGLPARFTAPAMAVAPLITKVRSWSRAGVNLRGPAPGVLALALRRGFYGPGGATAHNRRRMAAQVGRSHPATTAQLVDEMLVHDRLEGLAALAEVPTVVLAGTKDGLCPMAHSRAMASATPNSELIVYPGAGHMLPYERADEVTAELVRLANRRS